MYQTEQGSVPSPAHPDAGAFFMDASHAWHGWMLLPIICATGILRKLNRMI